MKLLIRACFIVSSVAGRLFVILSYVVCMCEDNGDKTQCERWRDASWTQPGEYQPKCTETGDFAPLQCHANTRECWCVRPDGQEITGTRISRGHKPVCPPDRGMLTAIQLRGLFSLAHYLAHVFPYGISRRAMRNSGVPRK